MTKKSIVLIKPDELIMNQIYFIRGHKVMIDRDLAALYNVETRVLKQAVKRNMERFPDDFMFEMNPVELKNWRSQIASSNSEKMGIRYAPYCFTEQGVAMLSSVLNSQQAIRVNIQIIRIFTRLRKMLTDNTELRLEIEKIKKKLDNNGKNMEIVFKYLDELLEQKKKVPERIPIGFKIKQKKKRVSR
jgi:regulator of replication initiation timing